VTSNRLADALQIAPLTVPIARLAGHLTTNAGRGSAVDAMVVANAVRLGGGIIATAIPST